MAKTTQSARKAEQTPEIRCATCGHLESEHGVTGSRPCLAMTGELLEREFCRCDSFTRELHKAA